MKILKRLSFLTGVIIITSIIREYYYDKKYNSTKLNITFADLKDSWGKPDYEFVPNSDKDCRVFKYDKSIFGQYVFISDGKDKFIVRKAFDD